MRKRKGIFRMVLVFALCVCMIAGNISTSVWADEYVNDSETVETTALDTEETTAPEETTVPQESGNVSESSNADVSNEETNGVSSTESVEPSSDESAETQAEEDEIMSLAVGEDDVVKIGDNGYGSLEEAIAAAQAGDTLELLADVTLGASTTIKNSITIKPADGKAATIHRGAFNPAMFNVNGATVTLSGNLTIDGAKADNSKSYGSIFLCQGGTAAAPSAVIMNAGVTLQNNEHGQYQQGGAITLNNGVASFTMNGGAIINCGNTNQTNDGKDSSSGGGAIRMIASSSTANVTAVMNGGTISNCYAVYGGAAFLATKSGKASFTMNGGTISGCVAGKALGNVNGEGSAFYTYNSKSIDADSTTVTINGGEITGCKAKECGTLGSYKTGTNTSGRYYILGGHIHGNAAGYNGVDDGTPGNAYGRGVFVQSLAGSGKVSALVIGGNAVIDDEVYIKSGSDNYITIRDDFSGSVKVYSAAYSTSSSDGNGKMIAKATGTASDAVAGRVTVTDGKFNSSGNYVVDEDGNIVPRYIVIADPADASQYILADAPSTYTVTYTDGVENEEIFADEIYKNVKENSETPAFTGSLVRKGYEFTGWDPEVAEKVTADAVYTAQWKECEHVWGDPVFDAAALTNTYTCTKCGETKVEKVIAKIESNDTYYSTLQDALDAAKALMVDETHENQTVTLLGNVTECVKLTWVKTLKTKNNFFLTIDLNGFTITGDGTGSVMEFNSSGNGAASKKMIITIDDTSAAGTGTITGGVGKSSGSLTYGGAIYSNSKVDIVVKAGTFTGNSATYGGAISLSAQSVGSLTLEGGTFTKNTASNNGGAIYVRNLYMKGGTITENTAANGGGVYAFSGYSEIMEMTGGKIYNNTATTAGDDIVYRANKSNSHLTLTDASAMGVEGISTWYTDAEGNRYADGNAEEFTDYTNNTTQNTRYDLKAGKPWTPAAPERFGGNVTEEFVKIICDTDAEHHPDTVIKWVSEYTKAVSDVVWNEELGTWTVNVRLNALDTMYLRMNYEKKVGVDHDFVVGKPLEEGQDSYEVTMKWDTESEKWVHMDNKPLEFHVSCKTKPDLPNNISGHQVKMVDADGNAMNWFVNVKDGSFEYGEIKGSREEGFTLDVTFHFTDGDQYIASWTANRGEGYHYDWTQTEADYTVTLTYNGSLTGTLGGSWKYGNYKPNQGTLATVYVTKDYTITLDNNNGSENETVDVTYGEAMTLPTPEREGYTFAGWQDADGNIVKDEDLFKYSSDITLTAQWTANSYEVTLNANGGTVDSSVVKVTYDAAVGELPVPEREGYTFAGWVDADGNAVTAETVYKNAGNAVYKAQWTANSYEVTLDANGGAVDSSVVKVTYDAAVGNLPVPERAGYAFAGWVDADGNTVTAETVYKNAGNAVYKAQWIANKDAIIVDPANGENSYAVEMTQDGVISEVLPKDPVRTGYTFTGWVDQNGNPIDPNGTYKVGSLTKIVATWKANTYTITFDSAGGSKVDGIKVTFDGKIGTLPTPERAGYTFLGWYTPDGKLVSADTIYKVAGDYVLTAKWKAAATTGNNNNNNHGSDSVKTGETRPLGMIISIMLISAAVIACMVVLQRRRRRAK